MELSYDVYLPPKEFKNNLCPVVLLHGLMDSKKTWKYIAPKIASNTGRKVYAFDARNHGDSPWEDDFTFDSLAQDLDNFLEQRGISRATLVGHSLGGRTALTLALKKPEKVEKLIIEDVDLRNFRPAASNVVNILLTLVRQSLDAISPDADEKEAKRAVVDFTANIILRTNNPYSDQFKYDFSMIPLKKNKGAYIWEANINAIEQFLTTDRIRQQVNGVYMGDTLFLYGTKSFFNVEKDPLIPKCFPMSTKVKIEGSSHYIHVDNSEQFIKEVSNFINRYTSNVQSKF